MLKTRLSHRAALLLGIGTILLLLVFPASAPDAVGLALRLCFTTLIPSLFPLFVLTGFLCELGLESCNAKRDWICRLLGISPVGKTIYLISIATGFPQAARLAAKQVERGGMSCEEADRITALASIAGPAFLIGGIGQGLLGSARSGLVLYVIQLSASFLSALTFRALYRPSSPLLSPVSAAAPPSLLVALSRAIRDGALAMVNVCATVVFFSVIRQTASILIPNETVLLIFGGCLEISSCAAECVRVLPRRLLCAVLSLLFAWSGCSIHAQVALFANGKFALRHYWVGKLLLCLYSLILGIIFCDFL